MVAMFEPMARKRRVEKVVIPTHWLSSSFHHFIHFYFIIVVITSLPSTSLTFHIYFFISLYFIFFLQFKIYRCLQATLRLVASRRATPPGPGFTCDIFHETVLSINIFFLACNIFVCRCHWRCARWLLLLLWKLVHAVWEILRQKKKK